MLERLKDLLKSRERNAEAPPPNEEEIVPIAAATVLLEVAWADHTVEQQELNLIHDSLIALYGVSAERANEIIEQVQSERKDTTSMYPFTRQLNERLDIDERRNLLVHLWRLNAFDGSPFHYEESVIRRISELLNLRHSEFIAAKLQAKEE